MFINLRICLNNETNRNNFQKENTKIRENNIKKKQLKLFFR